MRRPRDLGKHTTPYSTTGENSHRDAEIPPTSKRGLKGLRNRLIAPNDRPAYKVNRGGTSAFPNGGAHSTEKGTP